MIGTNQGHQSLLAGFQQVADQRIDGLIFEEESAGDIVENLAESVGKLDHQDRVDAIGFQWCRGIDVSRGDLQCFSNQCPHVGRALVAQPTRIRPLGGQQRGLRRVDDGLGRELSTILLGEGSMQVVMPGFPDPASLLGGEGIWYKTCRTMLRTRCLADNAVAFGDDDLLTQVVYPLGREAPTGTPLLSAPTASLPGPGLDSPAGAGPLLVAPPALQ